MQLIQIGRWNLRCDPDATRKAFSSMESGSSERCRCADCLNFAAVRDRAYPPEALAIFKKLGIDSQKESEIWHTHRDEFGRHHYGGFFHLVGIIEGGKDAIQTVDGFGAFDLESIGNDFEFGFTSKPGPVPSPFLAGPFVRLEFQTRVPWVLAITESD